MGELKADIVINLDTKCVRCGKGGATQSLICLPCFNKALRKGEFNYILKKYKPNGYKIKEE